ncbi:MAG: PRC-barrel domain-containing protein [Planctomycetales bacterium]|nr:PRC-barrel domain-containing protein [Planctomycetales bacterium]MBN8626437.1 PRC-barrel domain-containing protein [Planctomycetota bacterium]
MNFTRYLLSLAAALALAAPSFAADEPAKATQAAAPGAPAHTPGMIHRYSDLKGFNVENTNGDNLGEIVDVVYDQQSGKVRYAAVSFGGFLGVGDKLFAVPWSALKHQNDTVNNKHRIVMNADKASLEKAPGFDADNWPNIADAAWSAEVDKFYGDAHGIKQDAGAGPGYRLSKIVGMDVRNDAAENLGEIHDAVIDIDAAQIRYFAVSFGGFLGVGDKLFAVPFNQVRVAHDAEGNDYHMVMSADKATLEKAPSFDKSHWPNMADPNWDREVRDFYGNRAAAQK